MTRHHMNKTTADLAQLAWTTPQVTVCRAVLSARYPCADTIKEFNPVDVEHIAALHASWNAINMQLFQAQTGLMSLLVAAAWMPWSNPGPTVGAEQPRHNAATVAVAQQPPAPARRRAAANGKRLNRKGLR